MLARLVRKNPYFFAALFGVVCGVGSGIFFPPILIPVVSHAQSSATLQSQIDVTNAEINRLQKEIAALQSQLTTTTKEKATLQSAIAALNLNIKKLQTSISL